MLSTFIRTSVFILSLLAVPTHTAAEKCKITNLHEYDAEIAAGNWVLKFLEKDNFLQSTANKLAPLRLSNIHLPSNKTTLMGVEWNFDVLVESVWLRELKTLRLEPISVVDATKIKFGGGMGDLKLDRLDLSVVVSNFLVSPQKVKLTIDTDILQFYVTSILDLQIMECDGNFKDRMLCEIKSSWSFFKSLFTNSFSTQLLKRVKSAHFDSVDVSFSKFGQLDVNLVDAGTLPNEVIHYLMAFIQWATRESNLMQHVLEQVFSWFALMEANDAIGMFSHMFGSSC